jgi:Tfp pilus assembly protein PilX
MTSKRTNEGFALLVAVIFTSVMLAFTLLVGALGYKQSILANAARDSQYSFFAADAALECLLYADSQRAFRYTTTPPASAPVMTCNGVAAVDSSFLHQPTQSPPRWIVTEWFSFPATATTPATCAKVTVYKPQSGMNGITYLFSEGYSAACPNGVLPTNGRYTARGLQAVYR